MAKLAKLPNLPKVKISKNIYNRDIEKINLGEITDKQLSQIQQYLKIIKDIKIKYFGNSNFDGTSAMFFYTIQGNSILKNTLLKINLLQFKNNKKQIILSIQIDQIDKNLQLLFKSGEITGTLKENTNKQFFRLTNNKIERFVIDSFTFNIYKVVDEEVYLFTKINESIFEWQPVKYNSNNKFQKQLQQQQQNQQQQQLQQQQQNKK